MNEKDMSMKELAENVAKKSNADLHEEIDKIYVASEKFTKNVPVAGEIANLVYDFFKTQMTPELSQAAAEMSTKIICTVSLNAVPLSIQLAAKVSEMILDLPKKMVESGLYIEGISNPEDRPLFIQEFINERTTDNKNLQ